MNAWQRREFIFVAAILLSVSNLGAMVFALDTKEDRSTLRGITALYVVVENLASDIEKTGLTRELIQEDTEQRIRKAGIKVLSQEQWRKEKGGPWLHVNINIMKLDAGTYAYVYNYTVEIQLRQRVHLVRDPHAEVFATTWSKAFLYTSGYIAQIRNSVKEAVERFIGILIRENS
jgi:hypothetical protein